VIERLVLTLLLKKILEASPCLYEVKDQEVLFTKNYISKQPIFFQTWDEQGIPNKEMGFEEQNVRYTKIKKNGGNHK